MSKNTLAYFVLYISNKFAIKQESWTTVAYNYLLSEIERCPRVIKNSFQFVIWTRSWTNQILSEWNDSNQLKSPLRLKQKFD